MAYGQNPGPPAGGAEEDYYSDASESGPASSEETSAEDQGAIETTIPKSMLMGKDFKVGEEVVFEITGIHGEEVSIKYATEKGEGEEGGEDEGEESASEAAPKGDAEMSSMMY